MVGVLSGSNINGNRRVCEKSSSATLFVLKTSGHSLLFSLFIFNESLSHLVFLSSFNSTFSSRKVQLISTSY